MILQALDFWYLNKTKGVTLQVAGQDQWGNITAGIDLIRKKEGIEAYAFTMPLLTKSDGTKFGKTNGKAIWLDINKTSAYEMYQFFINSEDAKVIDYLKFLTFLSKDEIEELEKKNNEHPELREAHKALAKEVISFIHGIDAYNEAVKISECLFSGKVNELNAKQIEISFADFKAFNMESDTNLIDTLVLIGAAKSKSEARQFITGGGVYVNGEAQKDFGFTVSKENAIEKVYTVIRRGKKNYYLIKHE